MFSTRSETEYDDNGVKPMRVPIGLDLEVGNPELAKQSKESSGASSKFGFRFYRAARIYVPDGRYSLTRSTTNAI